MILVTVGSTQHDDLVRAVDELVKVGKIKEKVICQIGYGKYIPKNCEYFRFDADINKYYKKCKNIICTDGAGTIFRNLAWGNKIISVRHPTTRGAYDLGQKLSQDNYIYFITHYNKLKELQAKILTYLNSKKPLKRYTHDEIDISKIINIIEAD